MKLQKIIDLFKKKIINHNKNLLVKYHNGNQKVIDCIEGPRGLSGEPGKPGEPGKTEIIYRLEDPCGYKIFNIEKEKIQILIHPTSFVHAIVFLKGNLIKFLAHDTKMTI